MEKITLSELIQAVDGQLLGEFHEIDLSCVDTDSRTIHRDSLFIPLVGERFDGHAYIAAALDRGSAGCLTAQELEHRRPDKFYIKVSDTEKALGHLAAWYKTKFQIPFVAVTGSVGKTTARDMIAAVLSRRYRVLKTEGNWNNNIGLPLTLLQLMPSHQACVLELGMDRLGEIDYLSGLVQPQIGIITNIGDAHIERLGSRERIFQAKCELLPHIRTDGLLILNGDDAMLSSLRGATSVSTIFCGTGDGLDYRAVDIEYSSFGHIRFRMITPHMDQIIQIPAPGKHMIYPALLAAAVGEAFHLSSEEIKTGLLQFIPTRMRMNVMRRNNNIMILDDTYNANPQSMRAAIHVLADAPTKHKVAVLGDMLELGSFAPALHTEMGKCLGAAGIPCVVTVGTLADYIAEGARMSGVPTVYQCRDKTEAKERLHDLIMPDTTFLCKASRGMALEELSGYLMERTEHD